MREQRLVLPRRYLHVRNPRIDGKLPGSHTC
jgi:hypothetical protein